MISRGSTTSQMNQKSMRRGGHIDNMPQTKSMEKLMLNLSIQWAIEKKMPKNLSSLTVETLRKHINWAQGIISSPKTM